MPGYQQLDFLLTEEIDQLFEEGYDINKKEYQSRIAACNKDRGKLMELYDEMLSLPVRRDFTYNEPSEYDKIISECRGNGNIMLSLPDNPYDNFYGAWLGRCIGCALGQPMELYDYKSIKEWYENAGKYPVDYYVPTRSGDKVNEGPATDERICSMPVDDDIRFTALSLILLNAKGRDFDTYDVGANWVYNIPYRSICTAENQAYLNFANVDEFGPWGRPDNAMEIFEKNKVNTFLNPYREWIGAQIRIDGYGYAAAGNTRLAAEMAYKDAYLSHTKNGIYGAMFFAAMISAAFVEKDILKCYEAALSCVPANSRFYEMALKAAKIAKNAKNDEDFIERILKDGDKYNHVHAINNSAVCIGAMLYSKGDFRKAVTLSVACGMDTDCNGATVGSVMGALVGGKNIPDDLKNALNDTFYTGLPGYHPGKISEFAREYMDVYNKINNN